MKNSILFLFLIQCVLVIPIRADCPSGKVLDAAGYTCIDSCPSSQIANASGKCTCSVAYDNQNDLCLSAISDCSGTMLVDYYTCYSSCPAG